MPSWTCGMDHHGGPPVTGEAETHVEAMVGMYEHQKAEHLAQHDATPIDLFPGPPDPESVAPRTSPAAIASRETLQLPPRRGSTK